MKAQFLAQNKYGNKPYNKVEEYTMRKEKRQATAQQKAQQVVDVYTSKEQMKTDPLGSWTGRPRNANEVPVQDADDL